MEKLLILIRHAHRVTENGRMHDNGLSEKGKKQANRFASFCEKSFADAKSLRLCSSPYQRCLETMEPVADKLARKLVTESLLSEWQATEGEKQFIARIKKFYDTWYASENEVTIACSHGDWIPSFASIFFRLNIDLKKAGFIEVVSGDGNPHIRSIVQDLKDYRGV